MSEYLTTKELAELLRIKERKVYDLARSGEIPCSRAMGKLLFPRQAVNAWLAEAGSGFAPRQVADRPCVFLGSHDPVLEWALRESRCGIATGFDSSFDGLERFANAEGIATGLHMFDPESDTWNTPIVGSRLGSLPVVLSEWGWRQRGLIIRPEHKNDIKSLKDLPGFRIVPRQTEAGSQALFEHLLKTAGLKAEEMEFLSPMRSESDAALAVLQDKADATFGLQGLADQYRLVFVPIVKERFDILVDRRSWFEPPFQTFLAFCRSKAFWERVDDFHGYDMSGFGRIHFNGA